MQQKRVERHVESTLFDHKFYEIRKKLKTRKEENCAYNKYSWQQQSTGTGTHTLNT